MPLVPAKAKKICTDKPNLFGVSGKFAVDRLPSAQQYKSRELARIREVFVVRKNCPPFSRGKSAFTVLRLTESPGQEWTELSILRGKGMVKQRSERKKSNRKAT
jgi:hypothetical protein